MAKIRLPAPNEHFRRRALDGMEIDTHLTKEDVAALFKEIFAAKVAINKEIKAAKPKLTRREREAKKKAERDNI